jgi:membrane associated rhomboid family serine protease
MWWCCCSRRVFGNNIEDRFRKLPYLIFYLACGYVAALGKIARDVTLLDSPR